MVNSECASVSGKRPGSPLHRATSISIVPATVMAVPRPSEVKSPLSRDLGKLLESGMATDVTLEISGSRLVAHKAILAARSPVLRNDLRLKTTNLLKYDIPLGGNEEEATKQMLHFMYTDLVPQLSTYDVQVLKLATVFSIPLLKQLCEDSLAKKISVDNAAELAVLAMKYLCPKLKGVAIDFIRTHRDVLSTPGWKEITYADPQRAAEVSSLIDAEPSKSSTEESPRVRQPIGSLAADMAALLDSGAVADVVLVAGGEGRRLAAHRAVLAARCPALLDKERFEELPPAVLAHVLCFVYRAGILLKLLEDSSLTGAVLAAAEKLSLPELTQTIEQCLMQRLSLETVAAAAVVAVTNNRPVLRSVAVQLIRRFAPRVMGTDGWKEAMRNHTEVAVQICDLVAATAAADNQDAAAAPKIRKIERES